MADGGYLLDNQAPDARARLAALSAIFDPWTFDHLDKLGLGPGWRGWEVGAGGPSGIRFIAGRVAPGGSVVATDIDTSWAEAASAPGVEVRRHDVGVDPAPAGLFDLVHARLVLVHVAAGAHAPTSPPRPPPPGWRR